MLCTHTLRQIIERYAHTADSAHYSDDYITGENTIAQKGNVFLRRYVSRLSPKKSIRDYIVYAKYGHAFVRKLRVLQLASKGSCSDRLASAP